MKVNWGEKINLVLSLPGLNAGWRTLAISAPFNNTRTLKFKSQAANAVFFCYSQSTTVASDYWWALFSCLNCTRRFDYRALDSSWLTVAKNAFLGWALNFRVHMLLKGSVNGSVTLCLFVCLFVLVFEKKTRTSGPIWASGVVLTLHRTTTLGTSTWHDVIIRVCMRI